jgi:hypothetical protein
VLVVFVPQDQRLAVWAVNAYAFITAVVLIGPVIVWTLQQGVTVPRRLHLGGIALILVGVCGSAPRQKPSVGVVWEAYPVIVGVDLILVAAALLVDPLRPK